MGHFVLIVGISHSYLNLLVHSPHSLHKHIRYRSPTHSLTQLHRQHLLRHLAMVLALPDLRLSIEFPRVFAAVRALLLELLRTKRGLLYVMEEREVIGVLIAVLLEGEEVDKTQALNVLGEFKCQFAISVYSFS